MGFSRMNMVRIGGFAWPAQYVAALAGRLRVLHPPDGLSRCEASGPFYHGGLAGRSGGLDRPLWCSTERDYARSYALWGPGPTHLLLLRADRPLLALVDRERTFRPALLGRLHEDLGLERIGPRGPDADHGLWNAVLARYLDQCRMDGLIVDDGLEVFVARPGAVLEAVSIEMVQL